jgi:hypothetical protein
METLAGLRHDAGRTLVWRRFALAVTVGAAAPVVTVLAAPVAASAPGQNAEPYVLLWPDSRAERPLERRTEVGLVYTPEVLAALTARHPVEALAPRIIQAIREGTPIVVLWEFPTGKYDVPAQRPYEVRIAEPGQEVNAIPPVWIQQDAAGLEDLDLRISAEAVRPGSGVGVAVMAAFPRDAFGPGRIVYLVSHRVKTEHGTWIRHARYGAIEPPLVRAIVR